MRSLLQQLEKERARTATTPKWREPLQLRPQDLLQPVREPLEDGREEPALHEVDEVDLLHQPPQPGQLGKGLDVGDRQTHQQPLNYYKTPRVAGVL